MLDEIDQTAFSGLIGTEVTTPLNNTFDYAPATSGGDGAVYSTVFEGAGSAEGQYVYVYQIDHFAQSSEYKSGGMSVDFGTVSNVDGMEAFFVGNDGGLAAPSMAYHTPDGQLDFYFQPFIFQGQLSHQFGVVSPNAPHQTTALVLDSGLVLAQADVYANGDPPIPEPGSGVLFLSGCLVVGIYGLRFRRA
jgi:hypothetical protein